MKLPDEDKALPDIANEFAPQLKAGYELFAYLQKIATDAKTKAGQRQVMCLSSVLTRLLRLHYAAVKLSSTGIASEAKLQVRAMFEMVINLYALEQSGDAEEYSRKWIAWDLHNYMKQIEVELRAHPENAPLFEEHKRLADSVKKDLGDEARLAAQARWPSDAAKGEAHVAGKWKEFLKHGPSMVDLRSLATAVDAKSGGKTNMVAIYERVYPNASGVMHGSDLSSMLEPSSASKIVLKLAPTRDGIETVLVTSTVLLQMGALVICRLLGIAPPDMLAETNAIVNQAVAHLKIAAAKPEVAPGL
ncbi:MAG: hypothetical protein HY549_08710 [Elusimicrobia bacterium]|nr:hypothetical protein [Elusimicrobiota bacterium]